MSEDELQSWSFIVLDFRRPWTAEAMLESGNPKEKESEILVPRETGRLPGDTGRLVVCKRIWRVELGPRGGCCRVRFGPYTERIFPQSELLQHGSLSLLVVSFLSLDKSKKRLNKQIPAVIILRVGVFFSVYVSSNFIHLERHFTFLNLVPRRASVSAVSATVSKLLKSRACAGQLILNKPILF